MRRNLTRGFTASMEDNEPTDAPAVTDEVTAEDSGDTEVLEVVEGDAEGDANDADVAEAVDAAASLESICEDLIAARETGGINAETARMMNRHLSYIHQRQGISKTLPSLEAFAAPSSRPKQNVISLESVKDTLKRIWEAIKTAIKKSIAWLEEQFNKLFGAAEKLKKRAAALAGKTNGVTGTAKEKDFEADRIAKGLQIGGQVPASPGAELEKIEKVAEAVFSKVTDFNSSQAEATLKALEGLDLKALPAQHLAIAAPFSAVSNPGDLGYAEAGQGMVLASCGDLMGNKTVLLKGPASDATGAEAVELIAKTQGNVVAFNSKAKDPSNSKVKTLAVSEIEKIAKASETLADSIISYKAKVSKAKEMKNKLVAAADKAEKAALSEDDKEKEAAGKGLAKVVHAVATSLDKPAPQFSAYIVNTVKTALEYGEASLKQYGA